MKKVYVTPEISVYKADPTMLLSGSFSLDGGDPGNGVVRPQSLGFDDEAEY